jgi:hypothetical protein
MPLGKPKWKSRGKGRFLGAEGVALRQSRGSMIRQCFHAPAGRIEPLVLLAASAGVCLLTWGRLDTFWADQARWIFESFRYSQGQLPYRDYTFQYPPLSLFVVGAGMRILGPTFDAVQAVIDILSVIFVFVFYMLSSRLFHGPLRLAAPLSFLLMGAAPVSSFALYSMNIYSPALVVGEIGLCVLLLAVIGYRESSDAPASRISTASMGAAICFLAKPEFAMAAVMILVLFTAIQLARAERSRRMQFWRRYAALWLGAVLPAVLCYSYLAARVSWGALIDGITGYGQLVNCPIWPTGVGLLGVGVAVAQGLVLLLGALALRAYRAGRIPGRLWLGLATAFLASSALFIAYIPLLYIPKPFIGELPSQKYAPLVYFLANSTALMPPMWAGFVVLLWIIWRWARHGRPPVGGLATLVLLTGGVLGLSLRGLFNSHLDELPKVSEAACPMLFLAGPYLIVALVRPFGRKAVRRWVPTLPTLLAGAMLLYGGGRFLTSWIADARQPTYTLNTAAGTVRLRLRESAEVYRYVAPRLQAGDLLLDLDYGGGINFATHHMSPSFLTQYQLLRPSERTMAVDLREVIAHRPRLVIAGAGRHLDTIYGICGNVGSMFPRLVWRSSISACDPDKIYPTVAFVERNYRPIAVVEDKRILAPVATEMSAGASPTSVYR